MIVNNKCPFCGEVTTVHLDTQEKKDAFQRWQHAQPSNPDRHIQHAFGNLLTVAEREILISGAHDACFNEAFKEEDEAQEDEFEVQDAELDAIIADENKE